MLQSFARNVRLVRGEGMDEWTMLEQGGPQNPKSRPEHPAQSVVKGECHMPGLQDWEDILDLWPQGPPSQSLSGSFTHIYSILQHALPLPKPWILNGVDANGNAWLALGTERHAKFSKSWANKNHYPISSLSFPSLDNKMHFPPPYRPPALPSNPTANLPNSTDQTATGSHGVCQPPLWLRERRSKTKREPKQRGFAKQTSSMILLAK